VEYRAGEVVMRIIDNGVGFEPSEDLDQAHGCFGLLGMRERAREIRGELQILSQPGQGTEIIVTAPVVPPPKMLAPEPEPAGAPGSLRVRTPIG
jgi:signal transduction histidine kinase